ncbi:ATP-binding protein [Streptomyces zingiberis]|uniref:ATP-binding protein n=1 Tax=Streptomyces zingiberis TaxID=2053010 RepID=UPI0019D04128|nr:ATP-binding protein [Streptomyces zingiberis]
MRFFDQLSLAAVRSAVSTSRHFLRLTLFKWQAAFVEDDALLITSELVTNAVTATGVLTDHPTWGELEKLNLVQVRLVGLRDSIVIEVWDASPEAPTPMQADDDAEDGRGLLLVQQLAERWGSYRPRAVSGKVVWAELAVRPPRPTPLPRREKSARSTIRPVRPDVGFLRRVPTGWRWPSGGLLMARHTGMTRAVRARGRVPLGVLSPDRP